MFLNLSINTDWKPKVQSKHIVFNHLKSHGGRGGQVGWERKYYYTGQVGGRGEGLREIVNSVLYKKVLLLKSCILEKVNVFFFSKLFLGNLSFLTCGT